MPEIDERLGEPRRRHCYKCGKPHEKGTMQTLCLECAAPAQGKDTEERFDRRKSDRRVHGRRTRVNNGHPALFIAAMLFNVCLIAFGISLSNKIGLSPLKAISIMAWASLCIIGTRAPLPFQKFIRDIEKLSAYIIGIGTICAAVFMVFGHDPFALTLRNLMIMPFIVMGLLANVHVLESSIACWQEQDDRNVSLALDMVALLTAAGIIGVGAYGCFQDVAENNKKLQRELDLARQREIATCDDKDFYLGQGNKKIAGNKLRFSYNMQNAPENIREDDLLKMLNASLSAWSACGIPMEIAGPTESKQGFDDLVVVLWKEAAFFRGGTSGEEFPENSIWLNSGWISTTENIEGHAFVRMALQHEISQQIGHVLGLMSSSPRALDTMATGSSTTRRVEWGQLKLPQGEIPIYEQSSLPTACDIRRCRVVNEVQ